VSTLHEMNRLGYNEMNDLRYVFVAAPMSGPPNEYLANCSRMSQYSRSLIDQGVCPINPAADMIEGLMRSKPLTDEQYKLRSMELLRLLEGRLDAQMHVLTTGRRGGQVSSGVADEIVEARRLDIPVVFVNGWEA